MSNISELLEIDHNGVKAPVNDAVLTGDVRFPTTTLTYDNSIATTEFTRNAIKSLTTYYKEPMVYEQIGTTGGHDTDIVFDGDGNLYWAIVNRFNGSTHVFTSYVYKITPNGTITTFASVSTTGGAGTKLAFDSAGNLYWAVCQYYNGTTFDLTSYVYKITPAGSLTTFASVATKGAFATDLIFDSSDNLYWAVSNYQASTGYSLTSYVYKITTSGGLTVFASTTTTGALQPSLIFDNVGNLYWSVCNFYNGTIYNLTSYVYKITPVGSLSTFASVATLGANGSDLQFDNNDNLYWAITNQYNGTSGSLPSYIYKITPAGSMTTFCSINTERGARIELKLIDNNFYLAVSSYQIGSSYSTNSLICKIDLLGNVNIIGSIPTIGATCCSIDIDINDNLYWAISNYYNGTTYSQNSFIYRLDKQSQ